MESFSGFLLKLKPAMDAYVRNPNKQSLAAFQKELNNYDFMDLKIFHTQLLVPLVLKLEKLNGVNQDIRTGTIECITQVIRTLYLKDVMAVRTILFIVLKQIRDCEKAVTIADASEELKLAAVKCFTAVLKRSTSDVLEKFYTRESAVLLGQMLLALVEFIEREKYRILINESLECLMTLFYVHDEADHKDVVLRNQVADALFIYLPKIVTVLINKSLNDDKLGENLKSKSIKALGRILCIIFEETKETIINTQYNVHDFKNLIATSLKNEQENSNNNETDIYDKRKCKKDEQLEERLQRLRGDGRSTLWFTATSHKMRPFMEKTSILRAHASANVRVAYATLCCTLLLHCAKHLQDMFVILLESIISLSEDEEANIRKICIDCLQKLQNITANYIFNEDCEMLFDDQLRRLPRIIKRGEDSEQFASFSFLKGFIKNLKKNRLKLLLSLPKRLELFCNCLTAAVELQLTRDLLAEEYSLRSLSEDMEAKSVECAKLKWRKYQNLNSKRSITAIQELCALIGSTDEVNILIFEHLFEQLQQEPVSMNEMLLIMQFISCANTQLTQKLLEVVLKPQHWHLQLQPDEQAINAKCQRKNAKWYRDHTPGLYESGLEICIQDYDSDDELDAQARENRVNIADVQYNVLHTCIVLDTLGHCAKQLGTAFDGYIFRSLHHVLLKIGHPRSFIHQAAFFALMKIQNALCFHKTSQFLESHLHYIGYHLNMLLKHVGNLGPIFQWLFKRIYHLSSV